MDVKMGHADMNIEESSMRPFEVESTLSNVSQLQLQSKVKGKPTLKTQIIMCENPIHRPICIIQHPFDTHILFHQNPRTTLCDDEKFC